MRGRCFEEKNSGSKSRKKGPGRCQGKGGCLISSKRRLCKRTSKRLAIFWQTLKTPYLGSRAKAGRGKLCRGRTKSKGRLFKRLSVLDEKWGCFGCSGWFLLCAGKAMHGTERYRKSYLRRGEGRWG